MLPDAGYFSYHAVALLETPTHTEAYLN